MARAGFILVSAATTRSLSRKLNNLRGRAATAAEGDAAQRRLLKRVKDRFLREVDERGIPWPGLSPYTQKRKGIMGDGQILVDTGALYKSIRVEKGAGGPGTVRVNTGAGFRIVAGGSEAPYAPVHQFGSEDIPQRKFLGVSKQDVRSLTRLTQRIMQGFRVRV